MEIVYQGPKCLIPSHLENVHCTCTERAIPNAEQALYNFPASSGDVLSSSVDDDRVLRLVDAGENRVSIVRTLVDFGFPKVTVQKAVERGCDTQAALEWLMSPEGKSCILAEFAHEAATSESSLLMAATPPPTESTSSESMSAVSDITECSVCLDPMPAGCAAMRCSGVGGKRHYFHAECLSSWICQCQTRGKGSPTCPECRGPVQIQPRRFEEFLAEKGKKLCVEEREAMGSLHRGVTGYDEGGWFNVRNDIWAGAAAVVVVGVATALYFGIQALSGRKHDD